MRTGTRLYVPGGFYFFPVNLHVRRDNDLLIRNIDALRAAVAGVRKGHPFAIHAMVVLPEHLHALWRMPPGDADFSKRWRLIKAAFARALPADEPSTRSRARRGERAIWQRRFWEHLIRDEDDWRRHVDYIHYNPVKHGHISHAAEWPYSSIHRFIRAGWYEPDWGAGEDVRAMDLG